MFQMLPNTLTTVNELPPGTENLNRYANVIPNPATRVLLDLGTKEGQTDYINANHIKVSPLKSLKPSYTQTYTHINVYIVTPGITIAPNR